MLLLLVYFFAAFMTSSKILCKRAFSLKKVSCDDNKYVYLILKKIPL